VTANARSARARALSLAITVSSECAARLPAGTAGRFAAAGGRVEWAVRPNKRRQLRTNLAHVLALPPGDPAVGRLARAVVITGARRAADLLWAFARPEEARRRLTIDPPGGLAALGDFPDGAILASAHVGGFEFALACGLARDYEVSVVTDTDATAAAVARWRRAGGAELVPADVPRTAVRRLRQGGVAVVLCDLQQPGMRGYQVRFLDAEAVMPAGPAALARLTGAPIVPFSVLPTGVRSYRLVFEQPLPAPERHDRAGEHALTQALADAVSATLRANPSHWDAVDPIPWRARRE
jgi:lauroyl/myristoyl acyltransferase